MIKWFSVIAAALVSIATSLKSIAISQAAIAQQGSLTDGDKAAISAATAGLHASHDRLQAAVQKTQGGS